MFRESWSIGWPAAIGAAVLLLAANQVYAVAYWNDGGGNRLWSNPANWTPGSSHQPPASSDSTYIRVNNLVNGGQGPLIQDGVDAVCRNVSFESQGTGQTITMRMTGGALTVYHPGATNCYFRLPAGSGPGKAVFNMSGGTLTVEQDNGENGHLRVGSGYAGQMNLSGDAAIYARGLEMYPHDDSFIDLRDQAKIVLDGNELAKVQGYVNAGLITAYGSPDFVFLHYYGSTNKTRISAQAPGKAYDPIPADEATGQSLEVELSWSAGGLANTHDVYFGDDYAVVADAGPGSPEYIGNQSGTSICRSRYHPEGPLEAGKTYYWRVDEVGSTAVKGDVWSFTTEQFVGPGYSTPNPVLFGMRDSGVLKYNGEYYLIGTDSAGDIFASENLLNWGPRTHVFSMDNDWATGAAGEDHEIHACDLQYVDGVFHLYWSINRPDLRQIGHAVTTSDPLNSYSEPVTSTWFGGRIDPHLFVDDDGSCYFYTVKFTGGNVIYGQPMSDPWTLTGTDRELLSVLPNTWEKQSLESINEAQYVIKYRDRYYMLYNANHTSFTVYSVGCAESDGPLAFSNDDKYPGPVLSAASRGGHEITHTGQPTVVRGPNGFEWWVVYFARHDGNDKSIAVERVLFLDRQLYITGPSSNLSSYTGGTYTPPPASPTLGDLFKEGASLAGHWEIFSGEWDVADGQARQTSPTGAHNRAVIRSQAARHYLVEVSVKLTDTYPPGEKAGLTAFYQDEDNWLSVALDQKHGSWYYYQVEEGVSTIEGHPLPRGFDFNVYHTLRVERNHDMFTVRLDGRPAPGNGVIGTNFTAAGLPGLYTQEARAAFDGFIYTIGWDEYDGGISGWGAAVAGTGPEGAWQTGPDGIEAVGGGQAHRIFKGELLAEYEFMSQVSRTTAIPEDGTAHTMGIYAVYRDSDNWLIATIDLVEGKLRVYGRRAGVVLEAVTASVASASSYNLRAIKRSDGVRVFVDGELKATIAGEWGPAQVGLRTEGISARFNGITRFKLGSQYGPAAHAVPELGDNFDDSLFGAHWRQISIHKEDIDKHGHETLPDIVMAESDGRLRFSGCEQGDDASAWYGRGLQYRTPITGNSICEFDFAGLRAFRGEAVPARAAIGLRIMKDLENWFEIRQTDDEDGSRLETVAYNDGVKTVDSEWSSAESGDIKIRFDHTTGQATGYLNGISRGAAAVPGLRDSSYHVCITAYTSNTGNRLLCDLDNFQIRNSALDLNNDWRVDYADFLVLSGQWGRNDCGAGNDDCQRADWDRDGVVGLRDLEEFVGGWLFIISDEDFQEREMLKCHEVDTSIRDCNQYEGSEE